jgi:hypothetical protein
MGRRLEYLSKTFQTNLTSRGIERYITLKRFLEKASVMGVPRNTREKVKQQGTPEENAEKCKLIAYVGHGFKSLEMVLLRVKRTQTAIS